MLQQYGGEEFCEHSSEEERLVVLRGSEHSLEQQAVWDYFRGDTARDDHFPVDSNCRSDCLTLREQVPLKFG